MLFLLTLFSFYLADKLQLFLVRHALYVPFAAHGRLPGVVPLAVDQLDRQMRARILCAAARAVRLHAPFKVVRPAGIEAAE